MDILIVENSQMFSAWLNTQLQKIPGVSITGIIPDYDSALAEIIANPPAILILDLKIDGGNGIKILKFIDENNLKIKVLVFSNYNIYKNQCLEYNADYFFDKSNEFNELINTVKLINEESINTV